MDWEKNLDKMLEGSIRKQEEVVDDFFVFDELYEDKKPKKKIVIKRFDVNECLKFLSEANERIGVLNG